jgi:sugar phosphate isomerase/epimerase
MLGSDSPTDYVRAFHDRLLGVHWHYNDGKNDTHLFPSHEHSDWRAFLAALAETGYDLPVTVEAVPPDGLSLREAFRAAREVFRQDNGKDNAARGIPGTCEMCDNSVVQSHRPEASR